MRTLEELRLGLESGQTSAEMLLDECLAEARNVEGEGGRVFLELFEEWARKRAREMDGRRKKDQSLSPWAGIPIAVKDLFDLAGQVTRAGSVVLKDAEPAAVTAPAIARLEDAGFIIVGRTNMTEFAYSGVGINSHYGTPRNPYDRRRGRIPGGSSSGCAVAVTDGMAAAAIGTDTGGSCRIPAALTGITGFKPTARRIPLEGAYPLSMSLDSIGPLAPSVDCCAVLDDIMAGGSGEIPDHPAPDTLTFAVFEHYLTADMDDAVTADWEQTLAELGNAGVRLKPLSFPELASLPGLNARGGIAAAEAYAFHREQLERASAEYDPRIARRISQGAEVNAEELANLHATRRAMIATFESMLEGVDGVLAPTVPIIAPKLADFADDAEYARLNLLLLRNPSVMNFLDGCAISIPMHKPDEPPTGLMLATAAGGDRRLLGAAGTLQSILDTVRR